MAEGEGTYTLVVEVPEPLVIEVGALGPVQFDAGWYAYTGSAFGPGGFSRIDRHRSLADGETDTRHWHIDYLLGEPTTDLEVVFTTPDRDVECAVSERIEGRRIDDFGASDCACPSHLVFGERRDRLLTSVERAHDRAG
ncbi:GIY-YIG nuclease family protein [Haloarculaceae archaeon H-GB2-1]|nr:GIY-YIG nuclease family protein [Haloarculaceae archaeon H-GB1-1]MEA5406828.1 GIY-YIG nuclease family protein [Haloarculaceae archaeon H-GB2-1]